MARLPFKNSLVQLVMEVKEQNVTCEVTRGDLYRGKLVEVEDNFSCTLSDVKITFRDGTTERMDNVYIPGSRVRCLQLPESMKESKFFRPTEVNAGRKQKSGRGRGVQRTRDFWGGSDPRPGGSRLRDDARRYREEDTDKYGRKTSSGSRTEHPRSSNRDRLGKRPEIKNCDRPNYSRKEKLGSEREVLQTRDYWGGSNPRPGSSKRDVYKWFRNDDSDSSRSEILSGYKTERLSSSIKNRLGKRPEIQHRETSSDSND